MKLLIGILLLCSTYVAPLNGRIINCDDPEAYQAANDVVTHANAQHKNGYKFALQQIDSIKSVPSAGPGELFKLELDLLETTCPSVSNTPIENCPVRQRIDQAVEADCDAIVQKLNGNFSVVKIRCKSKLDSAEKMIRLNPDYALLAPLDDKRTVHAVDVALHKFNSGNNSVFYGLHEIGRGRIQDGVSNTVAVEFVAAATNCTIADAKADVTACVEETGPNAHYATCSGTVVKVLGAVDEDVAVQCTILEPQPAKDAPAPQPDPVIPGVPGFVPSRFHHNLQINNLGPDSAESNSEEQFLLAAHANRAVKRSLKGGPDHAHVRNFPLCPGRKLHP
ncbi:alpha-2-HS-glycoprotein [Gastrophryne carolinensis]